MFKKIAILGILITLFICGNLVAGDEQDYQYDVEVTIHGSCDLLIVGYYDIQSTWYQKHYIEDPTSGVPIDCSFSVSTSQYPPDIIVAKGWGPICSI